MEELRETADRKIQTYTVNVSFTRLVFRLRKGLSRIFIRNRPKVQDINKVKSRFYVARFHIKKSDDQIQNLLNNVSQFYVISRLNVAFPADQQYRKIEI